MPHALRSLLASAALAAACVFAADEPPTENIWPAAAPGVPENAPPEKWDGNEPGKTPNRRVSGVTVPTLQIFRPAKDKDTGATVFIYPGGGYKVLMMDYEGADAAKWLNSLGVTAVLLKYRVPAPEGTPPYQPALQDAQRALSLVRSRAKDLGLDPERIGVLGFSAGANLCATLSTNFATRAYPAADAIDAVSCRPNFAILVYPGGIVTKEDPNVLRADIKATAETPPAFFAHAHTDRVSTENSIAYYLALKRAGVSAELHIYADGAHGFGMRTGTKPHNRWIERCAEWMAESGFLKPKAP